MPTSDSAAERTRPGEVAPLVALEHVGKIFDNGTVALADLTLEVEDGAFLALLGPSGCGKSTALRILAGLIQPSGGQVRWRGAPPGKPVAPDDIGFVFQEPTLMPWARVAANVRLPLDLKGVPRQHAERRVAECLALVGLTGFEHAYPRELSGGMKMRVSLARALALRPHLLLMDEPFAALDEITRLRLNDDLLRLKAETGATIVFVTHSVYESVYLATEIAVMAARPGRIVARLPIPAPPLRDAHFRETPLYAEMTRAASAALHGAMTPDESL